MKAFLNILFSGVFSKSDTQFPEAADIVSCLNFEVAVSIQVANSFLPELFSISLELTVF